MYCSQVEPEPALPTCRCKTCVLRKPETEPWPDSPRETDTEGEGEGEGEAKPDNESTTNLESEEEEEGNIDNDEDVADEEQAGKPGRPLILLIVVNSKSDAGGLRKIGNAHSASCYCCRLRARDCCAHDPNFDNRSRSRAAQESRCKCAYELRSNGHGNEPGRSGYYGDTDMGPSRCLCYSPSISQRSIPHVSPPSPGTPLPSKSSLKSDQEQQEDLEDGDSRSNSLQEETMDEEASYNDDGFSSNQETDERRGCYGQLTDHFRRIDVPICMKKASCQCCKCSSDSAPEDYIDCNELGVEDVDSNTNYLKDTMADPECFCYLEELSKIPRKRKWKIKASTLTTRYDRFAPPPLVLKEKPYRQDCCSKHCCHSMHQCCSFHPYCHW